MAERTPSTEIRPGVFRSLTYVDNLMFAVLDFKNGPWSEPEPYHSHPHEQVTYIASGEIIFYCEGRPQQHLRAGDTFGVEPGVPHTVQLLTQEVRLVDGFTPIRQDFLE